MRAIKATSQMVPGQNRQSSSFPCVRIDPSSCPPIQCCNPRADEVEDMKPWQNFRRTFSRQIHPLGNDQSCQDTDAVRPEIRDEIAVSAVESLSTGIQVNMYHCGDCRRHIKYGKKLTVEKNGSESDSENSCLEQNTTCCCCKPVSTQMTGCCGSIAEQVEEEERARREGEGLIEEKRLDRSTDTDGGEDFNRNRIPDVLKQVYTDGEKIKELPEAKESETDIPLLCEWDSRSFNIGFFILLVVVLTMILCVLTNSLHHMLPSFLDHYVSKLKLSIMEREEPRSLWIIDYFFTINDQEKSSF